MNVKRSDAKGKRPSRDTRHRKQARHPPGRNAHDPRSRPFQRPAAATAPADWQPTIVFEDHDVLVLDKPPGVLSATPVGSRDDSAFNFVKRHAGPRARKGPARAFIIHRLDREASGLLVFAKNERAFRWLKEDFRAKRVQRLYLALVDGELRDASGQLRAGALQGFLSQGPDGRVRSLPGHTFHESTRGEGPAQAQLAVTHYQTLAAGGGYSLVQLRMETGRKHQIRVQLAALGHPVAGDSLYGARTNPIGRLCLHATELGFRHPGSGQAVECVSPAPAAFWALAGSEPAADSGRAAFVRRGAPVLGEAAVAQPQPSASSMAQGEPHRRATSGAAPSRAPRDLALDTSWNHVAGWYDAMVGEPESDHYRDVILPGTTRLLGEVSGRRILDVACGQGILCRHLARLGGQVTGVDASAALIDAARAYGSGPGAAAGPPPEYHVADARAVGGLDLPPFDAVTSVMALMNLDPLDPVLSGCAQRLAPNGALVIVILHPAFRAPRQTSWGFETVRADFGAGRHPRAKGDKPPVRTKQYRKVEGYLSTGQFEIIMNPGEVAHGRPKVTTWTFHRPLQSYVKSLQAAGFVIETLEEWPSLRRSTPGPRAAEENRARREIPLFLGMRAVKRVGGSDGARGA